MFNVMIHIRDLMSFDPWGSLCGLNAMNVSTDPKKANCKNCARIYAAKARKKKRT